MKKPFKILLGALAALTALWALAFAVQEYKPFNEASPEAKPIQQGLTRLRPVKEEFLKYASDSVFAYYADEKGLELPKGWQPPGTYELSEVYRELGGVNTATYRFDEPPFANSYVRVMFVTAPELRQITYEAYFLGIFPIKGVRAGYGLFNYANAGASVKAYHGGFSADSHSPVMWQNDLVDVQANYISTRDPEALADAIITGEGFDALICPLYADTPDGDILRYPTKLFFP